MTRYTGSLIDDALEREAEKLDQMGCGCLPAVVLLLGLLALSSLVSSCSAVIDVFERLVK